MHDEKPQRHTHTDRLVKANNLASMAILSGLNYDAETISKVLIKEGVMDLVRESSFCQSLTQQGIEEGSRERAIEDLLDVLEIRFDLDESDPLSARIAAIEDLQLLKQLHRAAIQVSSLEAFELALDA